MTAVSRQTSEALVLWKAADLLKAKAAVARMEADRLEKEAEEIAKRAQQVDEGHL